MHATAIEERASVLREAFYCLNAFDSKLEHRPSACCAQLAVNCMKTLLVYVQALHVSWHGREVLCAGPAWLQSVGR